MSTLHLGCGHRPLEGAVNHDRWQHAPYVDVAHDLDVLSWPWNDEAFDKVIALDVMEHLRIDVQVWLDECWRILKPGGVLVLRLPAFDNPCSYRDVTHRRVFHHESFHMFDPDTQLWQDYGQFYWGPGYNRWWKIEQVERVNPDPRYKVGDLGYVLRKRT